MTRKHFFASLVGLTVAPAMAKALPSSSIRSINKSQITAGTIQCSSIQCPVHADDFSALCAGMKPGDLYRTVEDNQWTVRIIKEPEWDGNAWWLKRPV